MLLFVGCVGVHCAVTILSTIHWDSRLFVLIAATDLTVHYLHGLSSVCYSDVPRHS